MEKAFTKIANLLIVLISCSSCSRDYFVNHLCYKTQPICLCSYYPMHNSFALIKTSTFNFNNEIQAVETSKYIVINQRIDLILQCNYDIKSDNNYYLCLYLHDELYKTGIGKYRSLYFDSKETINYLKQFDFYYLFCECGDIKIKNNGEEKNENALTIYFKYYRVFPFLNNQLKLDSLYDFYNLNSVLPFDYNQISDKYGESKRLFTDLFWNDMAEDLFLQSFNELLDDPPDIQHERTNL